MAMTVDPEVKHMFLGLARKVDRESNEDVYYKFYYCLRLEMDRYFRATRTCRKLSKVQRRIRDMPMLSFRYRAEVYEKAKLLKEG
jgi:hypothetical protein